MFFRTTISNIQIATGIIYKKHSLGYLKINRFVMQTIVNSLNKLLPVGKKVKKYLPFFIGFKLLTFTGFLTYVMNR